MSLTLENSIKEILEQVKSQNLRPAEEMRIAERLVIAGFTLSLQLQKAGHVQSSQFLDLAYTGKNLADKLALGCAKKN